ncbi:MAG TPA: hypothetical protein VKB51_07725 [bacterium]|nr:hypothetical protein [bacterium]
MINDYLSLSSRAGFNKSLAHFRMVTEIVRQMNQGGNLAEIIDALEKQKGVEKSQIAPILNAVVIDRMGYASRSFNLPVDVQEFGAICGELQKWSRLEFVIAYHHPQLGISLINPKLQAHWDTIQELSGDELVVLYVKALSEADQKLEPEALNALHDLLIGRSVNGTAKFGGSAKPKQPAAAPAPAAPVTASPAAAPRAAALTTPMAPPPPPASPRPSGEEAEPEPAAPAPAAARSSGGKVRMTPKYSVQVSNELFHNGNVEAWKNIVESYKTKYPGLEVHIFHDGQKVNNINALFKWGKVKHGDVIVFCVSGEEFKGVAKLQRYLYEGASIRFENFLKKDVNKVLNLF